MAPVTVWTADDIAHDVDEALRRADLPGIRGWHRREIGDYPYSSGEESRFVVDPAIFGEPLVAQRLSPVLGESAIFALTSCGYGDSLALLSAQWMSATESRLGVLRMSGRYPAGQTAEVQKQRVLGEVLYVLARNLGDVARIRAVERGGGSYSLVILRMHSGTMVHLDLAIGEGGPGVTAWEHAWRGGLLTWDKRQATVLTGTGDELSQRIGREVGPGPAIETTAERMSVAKRGSEVGAGGGSTESDPHGGPSIGLADDAGEPDDESIRHVIRALAAYRESVMTNEAMTL